MPAQKRKARARPNAQDQDVDDEIPPAQLLQLAQRYKIRFLKYAQPWPIQFQRLFDVIKHIGCEQYATYQPNENRDVLTVAQTRKRVDKLVKAAIRDYDTRANEMTLRLHTEPRVFKRFESEIKCGNCRRQLWTSEYAAKSIVPVNTERLLFHRTNMKICTCPLEERLGDGFIDPSETYLFSDRCSTVVEPDQEDEIPGHPIPRRRPDRVFGLNMTGSVKHYTQLLPGLRHTPFPPSGQMVYPFLIAEAKPGVQNPGFESIDAQTAFPIHTCLMLQKRLQEVSVVEHSPLLWYMPYQGDVWKLAACVIHQDEVQVYNLWMGSCLDPDGALQLLHIIDYIVEWARDTFRNTVLACLAGGWDAVERQTPLPSSYAPSLLDVAQSPTFSSTVPVIPEEGYEIFDTAMDDPNINEESEETAAPNTSSPEATESSDDMWCSPRGRKLSDGQIYGVVRHARQAKFEFEHIMLPDDPAILRELLQRPYHMAASSINFSAVFELFGTNRGLVDLTCYHVSLLKNEWLRTEDHQPLTQSDTDLPLRTLLCFESEFDQKTWRVVRRITCLRCPTAAMACLSNLIDRNEEVWDVSKIDGRIFDQIKDALDAVRRLPNELAIEAALRTQILRLVFESDKSACSWSNANLITPTFVMNMMRAEYGESSGPLLQKSYNLVEVLSKSARPEIANLLRGNGIHFGAAVLLRNSDTTAEKSKEWCLFILKGQVGSEDATIGTHLSTAIRKHHIYAVSGEIDTGKVISYTPCDQEEQFLKRWIQALDNQITLALR